jgi:hypothetical protein
MGSRPALMLTFKGLESGLLLADEFWESLATSIPGDPVVGVPARDVVIVTGSESRPGLERARRAVERVFFAGGRHLLGRDLLVRRQQGWEVLTPATPRQAPPPPRHPAEPRLPWQRQPPPALRQPSRGAHQAQPAHQPQRAD